MKQRLLVLCLVCAAPTLIRCGSNQPLDSERVDPSHAESAIVNGSLHTGHPAVGALLQSGGGLCTATLIGIKTVLTAAHCVTPGAQHRFVVANKHWGVDSVARHPSYNAQANNDLAIVKLTQQPPITPASISTAPPAQGQELTLIGYGATTAQGSGSGKKRVGTNRVSTLTSTRIFITGSAGGDANLCFGDSGGPSFATIAGHEVLVGVHSTIAGACGQQGHDMRVDVYADWIRNTAGGDVAEDGTPSPFDDQESPKVQITSPSHAAQIRGPVEVSASVTDNRKVTSVELRVADKPVAKLTAEPYRFSLALDPGKHRLTVVGQDPAGNQAEDTIEIEVLTPLLFGEMCVGGTDCATGICGSQDGESFCTQACTPDQQPCPGDAACLPAGPDRFVCGAPGSGLADGDGGCVVGTGSTPWTTSVPLLLLLFVLIRRRIG